MRGERGRETEKGERERNVGERDERTREGVG